MCVCMYLCEIHMVIFLSKNKHLERHVWGTGIYVYMNIWYIYIYISCRANKLNIISSLVWIILSRNKERKLSSRTKNESRLNAKNELTKCCGGQRAATTLSSGARTIIQIHVHIYVLVCVCVCVRQCCLLCLSSTIASPCVRARVCVCVQLWSMHWHRHSGNAVSNGVSSQTKKTSDVRDKKTI